MSYLPCRSSRLLLALSLVLAACSSPGQSSTDAAAEGRAIDHGQADHARPDSRADLAPDLAQRPDVFQQPVPSLGSLTLFVNLGDSIAAGYATPAGQSYRELLVKNDNQIYPAFQGKDLSSLYPGIHVVDHSVPGATSSDLPGQLAGLPDNTDGATLVVVSAGGNDLLDNYQALLDPQATAALTAQVKANLDKVAQHFADRARYRNPTTIVYFDVYDPTDGLGTIPADAQVVNACAQLKSFGPLIGPTVLATFADYNASLAAHARAGLLLADIHAAFLGHGFNFAASSSPYHVATDPTLWFRNDCIHPNPRGHHELRRLIWHVLTGA